MSYEYLLFYMLQLFFTGPKAGGITGIIAHNIFVRRKRQFVKSRLLLHASRCR